MRGFVKKMNGSIAQGKGKSCCGVQSSCCHFDRSVSEKMGYSEDRLSSLPGGADMGLGLGNPITELLQHQGLG